MPHPITPIGRIDDIELFDTPMNGEELLMAQSYFKKDTEPKGLIDMLIKIDKHQDDLITEAATYVSGNPDDKQYKVPTDITDDQLFKLKGSGYVSGTGRVVSFTKKGKDAIKKAYLSTENSFKSSRVKKKIV
jgi:hypothetical protein